jgi:uncharacterized protein (UPF0335 family)
MANADDAQGANPLLAYIERMERLLDEIEGLKDDLRDLKAQIRDDGFNVLALTKLVTIRRNKRSASRETELLNDLVLYAHATGTPLDFTFGDEADARGDEQPDTAMQAVRPPDDDPAQTDETL